MQRDADTQPAEQQDKLLEHGDAKPLRSASPLDMRNSFTVNARPKATKTPVIYKGLHIFPYLEIDIKK